MINTSTDNKNNNKSSTSTKNNNISTSSKTVKEGNMNKVN